MESALQNLGRIYISCNFISDGYDMFHLRHLASDYLR